MLKAIRSVEARRANESGFSLIDVVVTVAIIVALSIGGFVTYTGIVDHANQATVNFAAKNVYTSANVYINEDMGRNAFDALDEYNRSSNEIRVTLVDSKGQKWTTCGLEQWEDPAPESGVACTPLS